MNNGEIRAFIETYKNVKEDSKYEFSGSQILQIVKALEQPTTQDILSHIETGITATGQSDSYCVGFCNALIWLKACITHEEPQFFKDSKVSKISTGSTTSDDCVSRQAVLEQARDYGSETFLIPVNSVKALPPVTPTFPKGATNGDMIKALFPNARDWEVTDYKMVDGHYLDVDNGTINRFTLEWWNAPYKGVENGSN